MNGAELLIQTASRAGIDICFTNPGTTELPLVEAFDTAGGIQPVLGLFEGCCSGAADGYARMTGRPAMTLFHLGPGLGNAIANLHNARRAHSPLLNIVGDHATWHRQADPPLTMDIESLARTVSGWVRTCLSVDSLARDTAEAIHAARRGAVATLVVPQDVQWAEAPLDPPTADASPAHPVDADAVRQAAEGLGQSQDAVLVLGGSGLRETGLRAAARIAARTGCDLLSETSPAHLERGAGLPIVDRIPYPPSLAGERLARYDCIVLAGAEEPVAFFGYRDGASRLLTGHQAVIRLGGDPTAAADRLTALADDLGAPAFEKAGLKLPAAQAIPDIPSGPLTPKKIGAVLAALQPEHAIVVDEAITSGVGYYQKTSAVPRFSLLTLTGGAIGQGMPCAVGAALACPHRPVIGFQADGSALYTVQSLWMQARGSLNITTLICANQSYRILQGELARTGNRNPGRHTQAMMDLGHPAVDWVRLGRSMGVPGVSVTTAEALAHHLKNALREPGPHLIEMCLT